MVTIEEIVERVDELTRSRPLVLVAIDGLGGAGKSTLASKVAGRLRDKGTCARVIHVDDFAYPVSERPERVGSGKPIGGDFDWQRLRSEVLMPLRAGRVARYARYDWPTDSHAESRDVRPAGVVLIEGVSACRNELSELYDYRIWVECSRQERLKRGIARDGESARWQWEEDWMPAEDRYAEAHAPATRADCRFSGETSEQARAAGGRATQHRSSFPRGSRGIR